MSLNNPSHDLDANYWQNAMDIAIDPCSPMSDIVQYGEKVTYHPWSLEQIALSTIRTSVAIAKLCRDQNYQEIMDRVPSIYHQRIQNSPFSLSQTIRETDRIISGYHLFLSDYSSKKV